MRSAKTTAKFLNTHSIAVENGNVIDMRLSKLVCMYISWPNKHVRYCNTFTTMLYTCTHHVMLAYTLFLHLFQPNN